MELPNYVEIPHAYKKCVYIFLYRRMKPASVVHNGAIYGELLNCGAVPDFVANLEFCITRYTRKL
jgi:hypothetical protein